jgi:nicotinamide-nucleotide amidase
MEGLMEKEAIPRLKEHFKTPTILHHTILTYGTYEAKLAEMLSPVEEELPGHIKLAYLPTYGVIKLRLSTTGLDRQKLMNDLEGVKDEIVKVVGDYVFGYDSDSLEAAVGKELKIRGKKMATAESCTGGKIANLITSVPGSSEYFEGSVIAYSNNIKSQILNVDSDVIQGHGAVSREVVEQMARGVLHRFNVDYAISTSGIAGPGGGTEEKPVGTTWIAVAGNGKVISKKFHFGSHRERNIYRASLTGLNMLRKLIQKEIK